MGNGPRILGSAGASLPDGAAACAPRRQNVEATTPDAPATAVVSNWRLLMFSCGDMVFLLEMGLS